MALFLHLALYLPLFQLDILLFTLQVLRHAFFPRLEPLAHLFRLATHGFWLECAAGSFLLNSLLLEVNYFLAGLLGLPEALGGRRYRFLVMGHCGSGLIA